VAIDRNATLVRALAATARSFDAAGLEGHVADARAWLARDAGRYDVVFLDPPFDSDPWPWLFDAAVAHLAPGGRVYAEAGGVLEPPPALRVLRRDKAGHVHYHLLARAD
jgi:16S rRNA G966 N2-methylase RsmD